MRFLQALFALSVLTAYEAHAEETTGKITGAVYSPDGAELPGVKIVLTSPNLPGGLRHFVSAEDGGFTFNDLAPGKYDLKASNPGLETYTKKGIIILPGKTASVYIAMEFATNDEDYVVLSCGAYLSLDLTTATQGDSIGTNDANRFPSDRSYPNTASFFTPGMLNFDRQNPNIHGGSFRNNRYLVDGLDLTDPVTLTSSVGLGFDSLQQIEILSGGLDAEYNTFGGILNIVTESGSYGWNDFTLKSSYYVNSRLLSPSSTPLNELKGTNTTGTTEASLAVGGPLLKDKLVYYASITHQAATVPSLDTTEFDSFASRLKLTYQPNRDNTLTFTGGAYPSTLRSAFAGERRQGGFYTTAHLDSFLGKNLLFKASTGFNQSSFSRDEARFETRSRVQNEASLLYIKNNWWGDHGVKAGIQNAPTSFSRGEEKFSAVETGLYLQDQWKPTPFVSITPGLRFDHFSAFEKTTGARDKVLSYSGFGPRLGLIWDPTHDGKTKLAVYAGRFIEPGNLALPAAIREEDHLLACDPALLEEASTAVLFEECRAPIMKERSFVVERSVGLLMNAGINGIWRHQYHLFEDDEANLLYDERGTTLIGAINGDTTQSILRVGTPDEAFTDYKGLDFYLWGKPNDDSLMKVSYTYSVTTGTKGESSGTQLTSFMDNPQQNAFAEGYLPWHAAHVFKASGSYEFSFGLEAGVIFNYRSGQPFDQLFFNSISGGFTDRRAPRGFGPGRDLNDPGDDLTLQLPNVSQLDLRLQYSLETLPRRPLRISLDVFNLFNASAALAVDQSSTGRFGQVTRRQAPLSLQLGLRYEY